MWHVCGRGEGNKRFWWLYLKARDHLEDLGVDGDNIKMDFQEVIMVAWTGLIWLRIGTVSRLL
jgi:hypothetical protein